MFQKNTLFKAVQIILRNKQPIELDFLKITELEVPEIEFLDPLEDENQQDYVFIIQQNLTKMVLLLF